MAEPKDLHAQVARIHAAAIDQGFLTTLGEGFLALLYQAIDECPDAVLLTEVEGGRVLGFVTGAESMRPIYGRMLRHLPRLARALAPVILSPRKLWRVLELLRHASGSATPGSSHSAAPTFELLSLAVAPEARRRGVARRLYARLADHARETGAAGFRIVVGAELKGAHRFYTEMGARPAGEIAVHGSETSTLYVQMV